ncbi:MAG: hypothetical protein WAO98_02975 [Alphaproteobacteria bacterium]
MKTRRSAPPKPPENQAVGYAEKLFWLSAFSYSASWIAYLFVYTKALRGFFGDGALAFLIYLSNSYVFLKPSHWIYLFSVGFPRDAHLLLNSIGLQVALWLNVQDPMVFKYIYVLWQGALPGILYFILFTVLWRTKNISWGVFPLISWAILSIPVEWNALNSARVAMPIFWMHFLLVILAGQHIKLWPTLGAALLGFALVGGLYESVMLHCALCVGLGTILWIYKKNITSLFYALAAVPGALRAFYSYWTVGHTAPNDFQFLTLPSSIFESYFFFICVALFLIVVIGIRKLSSKYVWLPLIILLFPAINAFTGNDVSIWQQGNMRFDYALLTLGLMAWAGILRLQGNTTVSFALPAATTALATGTLLWVMQIEQTYSWQNCRAAFETARQYKGVSFSPEFNQCRWDWTTPWMNLLLADGGRVSDWPVLTFWQKFDFVKKDGETYLHTNNWTLTSPSLHVSEGYLPIKTLLYDLSGIQNTFKQRQHGCIQPEQAGSYWYKHLLDLDDENRKLMSVCPRHP